MLKNFCQEFEPKNKIYPHFDKPLPLHKINMIVRDPVAVAQNSFFPFIKFESKQRKMSNSSKPKIRSILYASRRDSNIYSYYRSIIAPYYEQYLIENNISHCPIAYRRIPKLEGGLINKSTIDFSKEAFDEIKRRKNCYSIILDITDFFGTINHERLHARLLKILKMQFLPADYFAVFKSLTQYRFVDRKSCYEAVEYKCAKDTDSCIRSLQICSPNDFRKKICGGAPGYNNLIQKNSEPHGIPQGAALSDLFANIYLIEFDKEMNALASSVNGYYRRYSDDILFICPTLSQIEENVIDPIKKLLDLEFLSVNDSKIQIIEFFNSNSNNSFKNHKDKNKKMEYLGFSFDGSKVLIKNKSLSRFYKRMAGESKELAKFNKKTNFCSYSSRSSKAMGLAGTKIIRQLKKRKMVLKLFLKRHIEKEMIRARRM